MKYDKLIRDRIPLLIPNKKVITKKITDQEEIIKYAKMKLEEEIAEFLETPNHEEAADVIESFYNLYKNILGVYPDDLELQIESERTKKRIKKGGFSENIILLEVEDD